MSGLVQLDDQRGPYPEITQCYHRGSVMIKDIVSSASKFPPIVHAQALCIDKDHTKKKPSAIEKPKKPEVPEDNVWPPKVEDQRFLTSFVTWWICFQINCLDMVGFSLVLLDGTWNKRWMRSLISVSPWSGGCLWNGKKWKKLGIVKNVLNTHPESTTGMNNSLKD